MASNDTDIQLRIRAAVEGLAEISKLITEVDTLGGETESSSEQVGSLGDELQRLGEQNATLTQFANLKRSTADLGEGLEQARSRATGMGKALADVKKELTASNAAYSASRQETERLAAAHAEAKAKVDLLRQANSDATTVTREQRQALKDARDQVRQLGEQYKTSASQSNELKRGLESTDKALRQQTREFTSARREVQTLDAQYQRQSGTLNGLRRSLTDAGINTRQLASEQKRLETASQQAASQIGYLKNQLTGQAGALRSTTTGLSDYSTKARQAGERTEQLQQSVQSGGSSWRDFIGRITGAAAAYFSFDQLISRATGMIRTADEMERLSVSLNSVEGSAAAGQQALSWLQEFNEKTPFQLNQITSAFIKAKNFGLDPYNGVLQAAADYTAKTAGTYQDLEGVITALGQAYTKGKLQAEEMNQLNERSVPAAQLLAREMGKTTDEIIAMASAGELGRSEIELLIKAMGEDAAGASAAMSQTFSGIWSNFQDQISKVELAVANAGIFDYIKTELSSVTSQIKTAAADSSLAAWAREVSDGLKVGVAGLREFAQDLVEWRGAIALAVKAWAAMKVVQWSNELLTFANLLKTRVAPDARQAGDAMAELAKKGGKVGGIFGGITLGSASAYAALALLAYEGGKGLVKLAQDAGTWAAKMGEAGDIEQRVAEQSRAFFNQLQRQGMTTMAQFDQYKDVQILTAQEVANLSAVERTAYEQRLKGHREYLTGQLQVQKALEASGLKAEAMQYQADAALASMRQGFTNLTAAAELTAQTMDARSRPAVLNLISSFDQLKAKGTESASAINTLFANLQLGDPTSLQNLGLAFDVLKEQGKVTQTEIDAGLRKSLQDMSLQDLEVLKVQSMAAFDTMKQGAVDTAQVTESVLAEKLRRLGVDYQELQTGIDAVGRTTIDTFRAVATDVDASSRDIAAALRAAINKADTEQELTELRQMWVELGNSGKVSSQEAARGLAFLDEKIDQTKKKAAAIGDGFNTAADQAKASASTIGASMNVAQGEIDKLKKEIERLKAVLAGLQAGGGVKPPVDGEVVEKVEQATYSMVQFANAVVSANELSGMSLDQLKEKQAEYQSIIERSREYLHKSNNEWWSDQVKEQLLAQEQNETLTARIIKIKELEAALSSAKAPSEELIASAESALTNVGQLGESNLAGLRAALDAAKQKMDSLSDSASSTLNSLQDEMDRYNQQFDDIEQRRYQNQIDDLQAKLAQAQAAGNATAVADLQQAIKLAEQLHQVKMQQIQKEQLASANSGSSSNASAPAYSGPTVKQSSGKQVTINLKTPTGDAQVQSDEENLDALLKLLKQQGLRS
ncbi:tape measure protein [Aeromonas veronii]